MNRPLLTIKKSFEVFYCSAARMMWNWTAENISSASKEMSDMNHVFSADGLKPDAKNVKAIKHTPTHNDKQLGLRLFRMTNCLQELHATCQKSQLHCRTSLKKTRGCVGQAGPSCSPKGNKEDSALKFFNPEISRVLQCDASMNGLGTCLMQEGQPTAYASRSLIPTESNYAQFKKELLAIVFEMETFETYLYGRRVTVVLDHKPIASILNKRPLIAPKHLQRLRLRMQRYVRKRTGL